MTINQIDSQSPKSGSGLRTAASADNAPDIKTSEVPSSPESHPLQPTSEEIHGEVAASQRQVPITETTVEELSARELDKMLLAQKNKITIFLDEGQLTFEDGKYQYSYQRESPNNPDLPKAKEIFEKVAWLMVEYDLIRSDNQALREAMQKRNGFSVWSDEEIVSALNSLILYSGFPSNGVMPLEVNKNGQVEIVQILLGHEKEHIAKSKYDCGERIIYAADIEAANRGTPSPQIAIADFESRRYTVRTEERNSIPYLTVYSGDQEIGTVRYYTNLEGLYDFEGREIAWAPRPMGYYQGILNFEEESIMDYKPFKHIDIPKMAKSYGWDKTEKILWDDYHKKPCLSDENGEGLAYFEKISLAELEEKMGRSAANIFSPAEIKFFSRVPDAKRIEVLSNNNNEPIALKHGYPIQVVDEEGEILLTIENPALFTYAASDERDLDSSRLNMYKGMEILQNLAEKQAVIDTELEAFERQEYAPENEVGGEDFEEYSYCCEDDAITAEKDLFYEETGAGSEIESSSEETGEGIGTGSGEGLGEESTISTEEE